MNLTTTQCCAAMEMYGMGTLDDPKAHLLSVCQQIFPNQVIYGRADLSNEVYSHYIFHGVVKYKEGTVKDSRYSDRAPTNLAKFIRANKLGTVVGSAPEWNRVNHKTHLVRVWVWTPNPEALRKWYAKYRPENLKPKPHLKLVYDLNGHSSYHLVMPILYGEEGYTKVGCPVKVIKEKATQADLQAALTEMAAKAGG